jgi:hypothetical protein
MLTALVHANATPGALAATLSALVPAVADGLISHAVVVLPQADAASERIADAMGATVLIQSGGHWPAAARIARGAWVLLLDAGEMPQQGWIGVIERHLLLQTAQNRRPAMLPLEGVAGWGERVLWMLAASAPRSGLIAPREPVAAGASGGAPVRLPVKRARLGA